MSDNKIISLSEAIDIISRVESVSRASALEKFEELTKMKGELNSALVEVMKKDRNYWLGKHQYKISYNEKEDRWRTYLPPNKKSVAKRKLEDLENYIIEFYKKQEEMRLQKD